MPRRYSAAYMLKIRAQGDRDKKQSGTLKHLFYNSVYKSIPTLCKIGDPPVKTKTRLATIKGLEVSDTGILGVCPWFGTDVVL
jgi:hypothetical protein